MALYELPVLCLCADLVRSTKLRRDFDSNPYAIMAAYGLDDAAMEAFYTMFSALPGTTVGTWQGVADYIVNNEISTFVVDKLLPEPSDTDCRPPVAYPNPEPMLYKFSPATAASGSTNTSITVKGMGLWKQTEILLRNGGTLHSVLSGTPVGTYRCSHLKGKLNLSAVPAGTYVFVARNVTTIAANQREFEHATPFVVT